VSGAAAADLPEAAAKWIEPLVKDLQAARGRSLIIAGDGQPAAVHALAHAMNLALGNAGSTVVFTETPELQPVDQRAALRELVGEMNAGTVEFLLVLGGNPVYTAPADLQFDKALDKVGIRAHLGLYEDETAALCHWHIPEAHFLEAWSDVRSDDGTVSIVQPLIAPLYGGKSVHEVLAAVTEGERPGYDVVREHWAMDRGGLPNQAAESTASAAASRPAASAPATQGGRAGAPAAAAAAGAAAGAPAQNQGPATFSPQPAPSPFDLSWRRWLHDGLIADTAFAPKQVRLVGTATGAPARTTEGLEVVFRPDPSIHDGRFANNAWLQELPKSLTKLTWDNAALIAPTTAQRLGVASGDVVELKQGNRTLRIPVWLNMGHALDTLTLHTGYGRTRAGRVGNGTGFNVNPLRTMAAFDTLAGVSLTKVDETYELACTQDHWYLEGRNIMRVGTVEQFTADPTFAQKQEHLPIKGITMVPDYRYDGYAWGMTIDQNVCTGCNACVVACQSENNVPVVG